MTNTQLLAIAKKQLGNGGSKYRSYVGAGGNYCNMFVYWLFNANGCGSLFSLPKTNYYRTYCPDSIKWCRKNLAEIPPYLAMACDIIYMDWEPNGVPNHIGIVDHKISTAKIATVEGNTKAVKNGKAVSGIVAAKTRNTKYTNIYRPHFAPNVKLQKLKLDSDCGYQTIAGIQKLVGATVNGILSKGTVKKLQAYCGASQDGAWGPTTSKKLQSKMAKEGYYTGSIDGAFGPKSVYGLQRLINARCFSNKPKPEPKPTPVPTPPTTEPTTYTGTFPMLPPKTAKIAVECAYAYGTKLSRYKYKGGKPKDAYKKRLNQAYPNRKGWKYAKSRAGASCDVFAGTVLKCAGYKTAPHAMSKMVAWCRTHLKAAKTMQNGDVLTRTNHVMICVDLKGKKMVANAHYQDHGGTYGIIQSIGKYTKIWRPKGTSYFSKGDTFTDVRKLQRFLNWYGNYGLAEDFIFGTQTEDAVKDFQKKEGLTVNGRFGSEELAQAKRVRK